MVRFLISADAGLIRGRHLLHLHLNGVEFIRGIQKVFPKLGKIFFMPMRLNPGKLLWLQKSVFKPKGLNIGELGTNKLIHTVNYLHYLHKFIHLITLSIGSFNRLPKTKENYISSLKRPRNYQNDVTGPKYTPKYSEFPMLQKLISYFIPSILYEVKAGTINSTWWKKNLNVHNVSTLVWPG